MAAFLRAEFVRTGYDADTVLVGQPNLPDRLTVRIVKGWLYSEAKTVDQASWDFVMARLAALPDREGPPPLRAPRAKRKIASNTPMHEPISEAALSALRAHRQRTKAGGAVLLRKEDDKPDGLTPAMISQWLSGNTLTARPEHVAYVLKRYEGFPSR